MAKDFEDIEIDMDDYELLERRKAALTAAITYTSQWHAPPSPLEVTTVASQFEAWLNRKEKSDGND
jgi:hypothetical protein